MSWLIHGSCLCYEMLTAMLTIWLKYLYHWSEKETMQISTSWSMYLFWVNDSESNGARTVSITASHFAFLGGGQSWQLRCFSHGRFKWGTHYKKIRQKVFQFSWLFHSNVEPMTENSYENSRTTKRFFLLFIVSDYAHSFLIVTVHIKWKSFNLFLHQNNFGVCPFRNFCTNVQNLQLKVVFTLYKIIRKFLGRKCLPDFLIACMSL